jgi:hypothetical protein
MSIALKIGHHKQRWSRPKSARYILGLKAEVLLRDRINIFTCSLSRGCGQVPPRNRDPTAPPSGTVTKKHEGEGRHEGTYFF